MRYSVTPARPTSERPGSRISETPSGISSTSGRTQSAIDGSSSSRLWPTARPPPSTRTRGRAELLLRLVVAVEDQPLPGNPRRPREGELAERRDVRAGSLLREQPQERDVRERLRPVDDEHPGRGLAVGLHLAPDGALAVHEQRRAVPARQLARAQTTQRELAVFDQRGLGNGLEPVPSIGHP